MTATPSTIAVIVWEGDSLEVLRTFPEDIRGEFGDALRAMQQGERPTCDARPMQSVGTGVFELKVQDRRTWYRTLYLSKIDNVIHVLHCFEKSSRKTPKSDLQLAARRLSNVLGRINLEKKNEKRSNKA
jgi:phage-related protein